MRKIRERAKANFLDILTNYDSELAANNLGIIESVQFHDLHDQKFNVVFFIIGFIAGLFTGTPIPVFGQSESLEGFVVIDNDGLHFIELKKRSTQIKDHKFFPFSEMDRAINRRNILTMKELHVFGTHFGGTRRYRMEILKQKDEAMYIEKIASRLEWRNISIQSGKRLLVTAIVAVSLVFVFLAPSVFSGIFDLVVSSRPVVLIEGDTYTSGSRNYSITFVSAHQSVEMHGEDIVVIHYDYHVARSHSASRPIQRFAVYQGDYVLPFIDRIRLAEGEGRGLLHIQSFQAGDVFNAMVALEMVNDRDYIRVVKHNDNGEAVFMHSLQFLE